VNFHNETPWSSILGRSLPFFEVHSEKIKSNLNNTRCIVYFEEASEVSTLANERVKQTSPKR
jgi:phage terminase large subunit